MTKSLFSCLLVINVWFLSYLLDFYEFIFHKVSSILFMFLKLGFFVNGKCFLFFFGVLNASKKVLCVDFMLVKIFPLLVFLW